MFCFPLRTLTLRRGLIKPPASILTLGHALDAESIFLLLLPTEAPEKACTWLGEISSCSCITFLPCPAWVLLSKIYKQFLGSLYLPASFPLALSGRDMRAALIEREKVIQAASRPARPTKRTRGPSSERGGLAVSFPNLLGRERERASQSNLRDATPTRWTQCFK